FDVAVDTAVSRRTRTAKLIAEARRVIVESRVSDLVEYLAGTWVATKLYEVFEDAKLAEFSARAMHLEGSFQRLKSDQKKLRQRTFRAVHEKIDKGMRESFTARGRQRRAGDGDREDAAAAAEELRAGAAELRANTARQRDARDAAVEKEGQQDG
ncbi:MAG: hypothetical protein O3B24_04325, partial [Verrucomicrobia bacterium]|nr:hypothetical protein [Verrucomicrobiota bacterium]